MTHTTSLGAKIAAAVVGGFVGYCLGIVFGSVADALIGNAFGNPGSGPFAVGHTLGMVGGLIGGAWLGVYLVGLRYAGVIFIVIGLSIAALGTLQFFLVVALSGDPNINPAVNGVLMWLSWGLGGLVVALGAATALIRTGTEART
jgi:hypothetical protein